MIGRRTAIRGTTHEWNELSTPVPVVQRNRRMGPLTVGRIPAPQGEPSDGQVSELCQSMPYERTRGRFTNLDVAGETSSPTINSRNGRLPR